MRFLSICSGIEAASVAFHSFGWEAVAFSEIEPYPSAALAHHYPQVPNLGDMSKFDTWPDEVFLQSDMIVGGPPCQAFSVAGARAGLKDLRGNLTLTYAELINHADAIRLAHGKPPVIILYENVPGLLSDKTNAFGCFLGAIAGEDCPLEPAGKKWTNAGCVFGPKRSAAWRVLDAQYFGVAQRRRRVFIVASAREGFDPTAVLFEFDGLRRDTAPSRETGKDIATHPAFGISSDCFDRSGEAACATAAKRSGLGIDTELAYSLRAKRPGGVAAPAPIAFGGNNQSGPIDVATARNACASASGRLDFESETFIVEPACQQQVFSTTGAGYWKQGAGTLRARTQDSHENLAVAFQSSQSGVRLSPTHATLDANNGSRRQNGVIAFDPTQITSVTNRSNPQPDGPCHTLSKTAQPPLAVINPAIAFDSRQDPVSSEHVFGSLGSSSPQAQAVAYGIRTANTSSNGWGIQKEVTHTLDCAQGIAVGQPVIQKLDIEAAPLARTVALRGREGGGSIEMGSDLSHCLRASSGGGDKPHVLASYGLAMHIRRLTPIECERLQGFPDNYTMIPWSIYQREYKKAKKLGRSTDTAMRALSANIRAGKVDLSKESLPPDGPRYKGLGNSWAVPVVTWIGQRIERCLSGEFDKAISL